MFLNESVMVVVVDLRQIALAQKIESDNVASIELTLEASIQRATDPSSDEAYNILRDHRPIGDPFFDRALLSIERNAIEHKVEDIRREIQSEILQLKKDAADIQGVIESLGGNAEMDIDEHAGRGVDFVMQAESIYDRLCSADTARLIRGSQKDLGDVQQEFGMVFRPMVSEFASRFNELLEMLLRSLLGNRDGEAPRISEITLQSCPARWTLDSICL